MEQIEDDPTDPAIQNARYIMVTAEEQRRMDYHRVIFRLILAVMAMSFGGLILVALVIGK